MLARTLRNAVACAVWPVFFISAQERELSLTATTAQIKILQPGGTGEIVRMTFTPATGGGDLLHMVALGTGVQYSILLPSGVTITEATASSQGFEWQRMVRNPSDAPTILFDDPGEHVLVKFPAGVMGGQFEIRMTAPSATKEIPIRVTLLANSPLRLGATATPIRPMLGETVILTAALFHDRTPAQGTVTARIIRKRDVTGQVSVLPLRLVSTQPAPMNQTRYEYEVTLKNTGPAIRAITATVASLFPEERTTPMPSMNNGRFMIDELASGQQKTMAQKLVLTLRQTAAPALDRLRWAVDAEEDAGTAAFVDGGPGDAATGDGLYTATAVMDTAGEYRAVLKATGADLNGAAFTRSAVCQWTVRTPLVSARTYTSRLISQAGGTTPDALEETVSFTPTKAGLFTVQVELRGSNGRTTLRQSTANLESRASSVRIVFPFARLAAELGVNGPYERTRVRITRSDPPRHPENEESANTGQTAQVQLGELIVKQIEFQGQGSVALIDQNGVAGAEWLRWQGSVRHPAKACQIRAQLWAPGNNYIRSAHFMFIFAAATTELLSLDFPGPAIYRSKLNGPYELRNIEIDCPGTNTARINKLVTQDWQFSEFEYQPEDYYLTAEPMLAHPDQQGRARLRVQSKGAFDGEVRFSVAGVPTGAKASWLSTSLRAGGSTELRIDVTAATPPGKYTLLVTATGGGMSRNVEIPLTVTAGPATVQVSPGYGVFLHGGQSKQFQATVLNSDQQAIQWSFEPPIGSVTQSGLYTAPVSIPSEVRVKVVARSVLDANLKDESVMRLMPPAQVSISPGQATLYSNQAVTLSAAIANVDNKSALWTMEPAVGRLSATTGASVTYTAPATVAAQQVVTVRATSVEDPTQSATASITLPPPVSVSVAPVSATLAPSQQQAFSATVVNPGGPTDVRWSIAPNVGSVSAGGVYSAPSTVSETQTVSLIAASAADPSKSATATVTLKPPVATTIAPAAATLIAGQTQQFNATVTGSTNTAVVWSLDPALGSITSAGLYSAPASVSSPQQVMVKATPAADPTRVASAVVNLVAVAQTPWTSQQIGIADDESSFQYDAETITLSAGECCLGGAADTLRAAWQTLGGDGSIVVRLSELQSAAAKAKPGIFVRSSADSGSAGLFFGYSASNNRLFVSARSASGGPAIESALTPATLPLWIRLDRAGGNVTARTSPDGLMWTAAGTPISLPAGSAVVGMGLSAEEPSAASCVFDSISLLSGPGVRVGASPAEAVQAPGSVAQFQVEATGESMAPPADLAWSIANLPAGWNAEWLAVAGKPAARLLRVTPNGGAAPGRYALAILAQNATYSARTRTSLIVHPGGSSLPSPWGSWTIGSEQPTGAGAALIGGEFLVSGKGCCLTGSSDSAIFAAVPTAGDFVLTARLASLAGSGGSQMAAAGVMVRESFDPGSLSFFAGANATYAEGTQQIHRSTQGAPASPPLYAAGRAPLWIKAVRTGAQLRAYVSPDGSHWNRFGMPVPFAAGTGLAGLAASNASAVFQNVSLSTEPDLIVGMPVSRQTTVPGAQAVYVVRLDEANGARGPYQLGLDGLPAGATAAFEPQTMPSGGTAKLTISAAPGMPPGTYSPTLRITGGGFARSLAFEVVVASVEALQGDPPSVSAAEGEPALFTIRHLEAGGGDQTYADLLLDLPGFAGASKQFNPSGLRGNAASQLTVDPGEMRPGLYKLKVTGAAGSPLAADLAFELTPAMSVSVSQKYPSMKPGESRDLTVTLRSSLSTDAVLSLLGLPAGVTAVFEGGSIVPASSLTNRKLTIAAAAGTPGGQYDLTVRAQGGGFTRDKQLRLTVSGSKLTIEPPALTLATGATAQYTIKSVAFGQAADFDTLSVIGLPAESVVRFSPASLPASGEAKLTISLPVGTSAGSYPFEVLASGAGVSQRVPAVLTTVAGFRVVPEPFGVDATPGSEKTVTLKLIRNKEFTAPVTLALASPPAGIQASLSATTITPATPVTLTVRVAPGAPGMNLPVTGTATGGGVTYPIRIPVRVNAPRLIPTPDSGRCLPGSTASTNVRVIFAFGFTGTVNLAATGLPVGAAATFAPASLTESGMTVLTLTAALSTPAGNYPITLRATSGTTEATAIYTWNVQDGFTLSAPVETLSLTAGGSLDVPVDLKSAGGFAQPVVLSAPGLPIGLTARFNPPQLTGSGRSTLTLSAGANAVAGPASLTLRGSGGGRVNSAPLNVSLTPGMSLALSPDILSGAPGSDLAATALVTYSNGATGSTALSLTNLPPGLSGTVDPPAVSGSGASQLKLRLAPDLAAGEHQVTVRAAGPGGSRQDSIRIRVRDFSIHAVQTARTVPAGAKAVFSFNVRSQGGMAAPLAISVNGLPAGIVPVLSQNTIFGSGSTALTLSTTASTLAGTYPFTVTASGEGLERAATGLTLTVTSGFNFSVTPASRNINAATAAAYQLKIATFGGFNAPVSLAFSGVPLDVTASLDHATITGDGTATLTLASSASTAAGTASLSFTATSGQTVKTDSATLNIRNFQLAVAPASVTLSRGGSASATVTVTPINGFASTVRITATGQPAGVTITAAPVTLAGGGASTLTLKASATAAPGVYPVVVQATSGALVKSIPLSLAVQ